jgi:peptide/nickel transport system permease protein
LGALGLCGVIGVYWLFLSGGAGRYALDILWHLGLPVITLALISFAGTMLLTRNSMLETLREDYILTARAKGLSEKVVRDKHAARNAMLPVVTSLVFSLAFALDGGVITETVFSWPGMGRTIVRAVASSDIPTAIGGLVFTAILALTAHLVADVLYVYLDPRVRYA